MEELESGLRVVMTSWQPIVYTCMYSFTRICMVPVSRGGSLCHHCHHLGGFQGSRLTSSQNGLIILSIDPLPCGEISRAAISWLKKCGGIVREGTEISRQYNACSFEHNWVNPGHNRNLYAPGTLTWFSVLFRRYGCHKGRGFLLMSNQE